MSGGKPSGASAACVINSEIVRVLGVMRRNVRWGFYPAPEDQLEHPLIQSLNDLRMRVFLWPDGWHLVDPAAYLRPFLDVIQSDETGAPITGAALSSVYNILTLDMLAAGGPHTPAAMHMIVQSVMSCRFEVTDPASEELVLMKILQILLACIRTPASACLSDQHICHMVNTCFRIVHQATSKAELLQRVSRHTMHELVRSVFLRLPALDPTDDDSAAAPLIHQAGRAHVERFLSDNGDSGSGRENRNEIEPVPASSDVNGEGADGVGSAGRAAAMGERFGVPCMVEILHFLCSLLNVIEHVGVDPRPDPLAYDEDVPLFALGLINCAVEVGGASFGAHPRLLSLVQTDVFRNVMLFGASSSPLILSTVCTVVLNLYHHLRSVLKPQLESFSGVLLRVARSNLGGRFQQQEVAMEALVDLCRFPYFPAEAYINFDCDVSSGNVFEEIVGLLSRNAFPVNTPLSAAHLLSLRGLLAVLRGIADRAEPSAAPVDDVAAESVSVEGFFSPSSWAERRRGEYRDPEQWVPFVRGMKSLKRKLMVGADHFNRDAEKGLEYLRVTGLLPPGEPDAGFVARFLRHTHGLDKNAVGDFLGNHDGFPVRVLGEFARTFDFRSMKLDGALRVFLETFRLPGESQKIQRVLEAFAGRYFEQSPHVFRDRDAALLLSYSIILLNTDRHNVQVKKKMTEEDFIRNNRRINGGDDLPREYLSELYRSICENEIRVASDIGTGHPSPTGPTHSPGFFHPPTGEDSGVPYISGPADPRLDRDMFAVLSGPTIAAICVVFDNVVREPALRLCVDGFLSVAKVASCYRLHEVLDDLVVSLCRFTNLLGPNPDGDHEELGGETRAAMATSAVFTVAVGYGDDIRTGWKSVLDCVLALHRLRLLPDLTSPEGDAAPAQRPDGRAGASADSGRPAASSLMGRFSQLLSFDGDEQRGEPSEDELASYRAALQRIRNCRVDSIFTESGSMRAESLMWLLRALMAAGRPVKAGRRQQAAEGGDEAAAFFMGLAAAVVVSNRERVSLMWKEFFEHVSGVVGSITAPCQLAEKAVFGLLRVCQRLLPEGGAEGEVLGSLQLILKLDARVADAYCEQITEEVKHLVRESGAHIRSGPGWRAVVSLLSITARHPEASESGFEALALVVSGGGEGEGHLSPANFAFCLDAVGEFVESLVGNADRSIRALDLMAVAAASVVRWSVEAEAAGEMLLRVVCGARRGCLDRRGEVRQKAVGVLEGCLTAAETGRKLPEVFWTGWFEHGVFSIMDGLLEVVEGGPWKVYGDVEGTVLSGMRLMVEALVRAAEGGLMGSLGLGRVWIGVLGRVERCTGVRFRGRKSRRVAEGVPGLVKGAVVKLKESGVLAEMGDDQAVWRSTWACLETIVPSLRAEVFPVQQAAVVGPATGNGKDEPNG